MAQAERAHQLAPGPGLGPAVAVDGAVENHGADAAVAMRRDQPLDPRHVDDERERHVVEDDVEFLRPVGVLVPLDQHLGGLAGGVIDRPRDVGALGHRRWQDRFHLHEVVEAAAGHVECSNRPGRGGPAALRRAALLRPWRGREAERGEHCEGDGCAADVGVAELGSRVISAAPRLAASQFYRAPPRLPAKCRSRASHCGFRLRPEL